MPFTCSSKSRFSHPYLFLAFHLLGCIRADGCFNSGQNNRTQCCPDRDDDCYANGPRQFDYNDSGDCYCDQACLSNYDCCADYNYTCGEPLLTTTSTTKLLITTSTTTLATASTSLFLHSSTQFTNCADIWPTWCPDNLQPNDCLDNILYKNYCCRTCFNLWTTSRPTTKPTFDNSCQKGDIWGNWCWSSLKKDDCLIDRIRPNCCLSCNLLLGIVGVTTTVSTTTSTTTIAALTFAKLTSKTSICASGDVWKDWCPLNASIERCQDSYIQTYCCYTCSR